MTSGESTVHNRLRFTVEDRFIVLELNEEKALLPDGVDLLPSLAATLGSFRKSHNILCDWRDLREVTGDVIDFVELMCGYYGATVLARPSDVSIIQSSFRSEIPILQVSRPKLPIDYTDVDLDWFAGEYRPAHKTGDIRELVCCRTPDEDEWEFMIDQEPYISEFCPTHISMVKKWPYITGQTGKMDLRDPFGGGFCGEHLAGRRYLQKEFDRIGMNSLLTEFSIQVSGDQVLVTPYHAHAVHSIEAGDHLLFGRPAVIAARTGALFKQEILTLEKLLTEPRVKEARIQSFLETHPRIFSGLGFTHVYPQVILQREDGTSLRPDFILEPVKNGWCDILEIKVPDMKVFVGKRDRKTLSASIHELVAQLREYAAYFESEQLSKRIQELYGIKCYRPRLIGMIGYDPRLADERQFRRLMTAYSDVSIITFDQLLRIAKSRMLI